jgi:heme oxygenase
MTILDRLRAATADRHERVERAADLIRPDLSRSQWAATVARFYGFVAPWEAALRPPHHRAKRTLLERDLACLGVDPSALPLCEDLPDLRTEARRWGSAYVLEGSTLGGQVIARHVEKTLGLRAGQGYSFFIAYGPRTGAMWRQFRDGLQAAATRLDHDELIDAAGATFDRVGDWLAGGAARVAGEALACP